MKVIIIGGGAAGFFTAINIAEKNPSYQVTIIEKSNKVLSKVKVSGGGRCNVTNDRPHVSGLIPFYPRGGKKLKSIFNQFSTHDMIQWLQKRGVETHAEPDSRVFPISNSSQTIIDCFLNACQRLKITCIKGEALTNFEKKDSMWQITTNSRTFQANKLILACGSSPSMWHLLQKKGIAIASPVPSLFTFNIKDERIKHLQGLSFNHVQVKVVKSKLIESGPLLITHWGLSGPAILKLSSWGARELEEKNYRFDILINFLLDYPNARIELTDFIKSHPKRILFKYPLWNLPRRFWEQLLTHLDIRNKPCNELGKKHLNKLMEELTQGKYQVVGKSTFKEEFVTAGGIKLTEINLDTFESKHFEDLYFAGEMLDIDALTGGFNFQACWSAGWAISENI